MLASSHALGWLQLVTLADRPGYTSAQLRQLAQGMEGGPMTMVIAGLVVLAVGFFSLLVVAARQTAGDEDSREADRARARAREQRRATRDMDRMWRHTAEHTPDASLRRAARRKTRAPDSGDRGRLDRAA